MENLESRRVLATFTVSVAYDAVDASPGDGKCDDDSGNCTLRAAIQEVNAQGGSHDIFVPSGTFMLAIAGRDEDAAATGDLDIAANATITGTGPGSTIIAAGGIDRVFHVLAGAMATLNGLTVADGSVFFTSAQYSGSGGGILNFGTATLTNSTISGNTASDVAGGVFNNSYLTITNSTVAGNSAGDRGGGIHNWGEFTLTGSTVSGNTAGVNGGGIANYWTATLTNSTLALNTAAASGGGIANFGTVTLRGTIVAGSVGAVPDLRGNFDAEASLIGHVGTATVANVGLGNNLIGGGGNPVIDPLLGPLQNNGGPTETHALRTDSPAIDSGNSFGQSTDQRGKPRPVDIPGVNDPPPGDGSDIGAFEVQTGGGTGPCSSPSGMAILQPNGVLQVEGTNQADDIEVREVNGLYRVRVNLPIFEASFDPNLIGSIRVLACDGNDEINVRTNVDRPTVIEGGEGNDVLRDGSGDGVVRGGPGNDQIFGNAGKDQLFGDAGDDVIRAGYGKDFLDGGGGDDTLFGNDGFDILLGGQGGDKLQGNAGRDVLIGGLGNDDIDGGGGMDLLIAGTTSYDTQRASLDLIMEEWSQGGVSQQSYAQRVMHLRNGTGTILGGTGVMLYANNTVFDDGVADSLLEGGGALDWFFADLDGQDGDDDVIVDLQPGEEVDLLN